MTGAANHRGRSVQVVGTPPALLDAVQRRFGVLTWDLAATPENAVAPDWFTEADDALARPWPREGVLWLNPPFANIAPWAAKCSEWLKAGPRASSVLLFLVPASTDANWWAAYVSGSARVLSLCPRVTFVGHTTPFPKGLALCVYDPRFPVQPALVEPWRWPS